MQLWLLSGSKMFFHAKRRLSILCIYPTLPCILVTASLLSVSVYLSILDIPFKFYLFVFMAPLGLCCCTHAFSSCGEWGCSSLPCTGFSRRWPLLLWLQALGHAGSVAAGLVSLWKMGSSQARDQMHVPSIGRWTLIHYSTKEVPTYFI